MPIKLKFPENFLWGAASSSYQIEGGNNNDWTAFEDAGSAAKGWEFYEKDLDLLKELNLNSYRFSIEWSRVEPERDRFDPEAIAHYQKMIDALDERGIAPMVTLHHFTNPVWIASQGGWAKRSTVERFLKYAERIVRESGGRVRYWCTINEPTIVAGQGYFEGVWPPFKKDVFKFNSALNNFAKAHNRLYEIIHAVHREKGWQKPLVGFAHNMTHAVAARSKVSDRLIARVYEYLANDLFLNKINTGALDYIGINYYFYHIIKFKLGGPNFIWTKIRGRVEMENDLGWLVHPEGIYQLIRLVSAKKIPIIITENGIADREDKNRAEFIKEHVRWIHEAIGEGADVRGYYYWSLTDNFEWIHGTDAKFGLAEVDYKNFERRIRKSAYAYSEIARHNGVIE